MPVLSRFHGIILRIPKLLPRVENLQAVFGLFKGLHPSSFTSSRVTVASWPYYSDPEGQRFESSRSHQEQHLMGCCSFCFAWILWSSKRGGFEQPVPRALRPAGQKRPGGAFLGRGLANPFGRAKKRIAMCFCNAFFVLMLFRFRIILVAYHLPRPCTEIGRAHV